MLVVVRMKNLASLRMRSNAQVHMLRVVRVRGITGQEADDRRRRARDHCDRDCHLPSHPRQSGGRAKRIAFGSFWRALCAPRTGRGRSNLLSKDASRWARTYFPTCDFGRPANARARPTPTRGYADGRRAPASMKVLLRATRPRCGTSPGVALRLGRPRRLALRRSRARPSSTPTRWPATGRRSSPAFVSDRAMAAAFASAFPDQDPAITPENVVAALVAYERSLVSPLTRFDRWVAGEAALSREELAGFRLFVGRAGCVGCLAGGASPTTASTTSGSPARTRAAARCLAAFRASGRSRRRGLREAVLTAPTCTTARSPRSRPSSRTTRAASATVPVSPPVSLRGLELAAEERAQLVAFLHTLSSEPAPRDGMANR